MFLVKMDLQVQLFNMMLMHTKRLNNIIDYTCAFRVMLCASHVWSSTAGTDNLDSQSAKQFNFQYQ